MVGGKRLAGVDGQSGHRDGVVGGRVGGVSVVEVGGQGLVELDVGHGLGVGGVEARRLVEQEVPLRRAASGREGRGPVGKVEVDEDGGDDGRVGEKGEDTSGRRRLGRGAAGPHRSGRGARPSGYARGWRSEGLGIGWVAQRMGGRGVQGRG